MSALLNDMKGRLMEIIGDGGDLIVVPLSAQDADATFEDGYADVFLSTVLGAAGNTEVTTGGWTRKVHTNANITATVDDTNDLMRAILDVDDTWTSVTVNAVALLICEDGASDAVRRVIGLWTFSVTQDGSDVTANYDQVNGIATFG